MKKEKHIWLEKEIEKDLVSGNKMENLFSMLNKSSAETVIVDFSHVEFMSRTVAQVYLNQKNQANFKIKEKNIPEHIQKLIDIIIEQNQ